MDAKPLPDNPAESDIGLFDGLYAAHREEGYAAGYRRAASDLLADLMLFGQEVARDVPGHDEAGEAARRAVRTFARKLAGHLERRIDAMRSPADGGGGFVADGLGI